MTGYAYQVLFAIDDGYAAHLAASLYSLLLNNKDLPIQINLITSGIKHSDRKKIAALCTSFKAPIRFINVKDEWFNGLVLNDHFEKSNYYRLFAADYISHHKCLYLDADTIIEGSIKPLLDADIGDKFLAAVVNPGYSGHVDLGMRSTSRYFNSGVMLLNLDRWRSIDLKNKAFELVRNRPYAIRFVDQCALNGIIDGNWLELDYRYNLQTMMLGNADFDRSIYRLAPIIVHFTGPGKPWHLNDKHPYKKRYWHYRNMTAYRSLVSDDFGIRSIASRLVPLWLKSLLRVAWTKSKHALSSSV